MTPRVGIVLVTYHSADVLGDCLASLPDGCRAVELTRIVVVDNASSDDSLGVAERTPSLPITTVQLGRNAGYAAAINAGVAALADDPPDAVLILNPDTRLRAGSVAVLAAALDQPGRGIVVPRLVFPDGRLQPSLRRNPTLLNALGEAVLGGGLAGRLGPLGELVFAPEPYERAGPAAWASGAALLISWQVCAEVGSWDESFLLYSEETDFMLRAADRGWRLWYEPASIVEHLEGESGTNPMLWALLTVNRVRLYQQRAGTVRGLAYHAVITAGQLARAAAGKRTSRAAVTALLRPSRRLRVLPQ